MHGCVTVQAQYPLLSGGSTGGFLNDTADIINNSSSSPSPAPAPAPAPGLAPVNGSYASGAVTNGTITVNVTCSGVDLTASGGAAVSVEFEAPVPVMSTLVALVSVEGRQEGCLLYGLRKQYSRYCMLVHTPAAFHQAPFLITAHLSVHCLACSCLTPSTAAPVTT
jgi:hypothetical protein